MTVTSTVDLASQTLDVPTVSRAIDADDLPYHVNRIKEAGWDEIFAGVIMAKIFNAADAPEESNSEGSLEAFAHITGAIDLSQDSTALEDVRAILHWVFISHTGRELPSGGGLGYNADAVRALVASNESNHGTDHSIGSDFVVGGGLTWDGLLPSVEAGFTEADLELLVEDFGSKGMIKDMNAGATVPMTSGNLQKSNLGDAAPEAGEYTEVSLVVTYKVQFSFGEAALRRGRFDDNDDLDGNSGLNAGQDATKTFNYVGNIDVSPTPGNVNEIMYRVEYRSGTLAEHLAHHE